MKLRRVFIPLGVFGGSLALTLALVHAGSGDLQAPPGDASHREASAFAEARAFLRAGDPAGAREVLRELAGRDPLAFFELLEELPGLPGVEDLIRSVAARLSWQDPAVIALLNRIGPHEWRDLAWGAYTAARVGSRPDEEVLQTGSLARPHASLSALRPLMEEAAEKRPEAFLDLLNAQGGTSLREEFFAMLMRHHPERAAELYARIPDGSTGCNYDRACILQVRARGLPTARNLLALLDELGPRGAFSANLAPSLASLAYAHADPDERERILSAIASQPPLARNRMLSGILSQRPEPPSTEEFCRLAGLLTSGTLQREALEMWLGRLPHPPEEGWIERLPTEKLRARARVLAGPP